MGGAVIGRDCMHCGVIRISAMSASDTKSRVVPVHGGAAGAASAPAHATALRHVLRSKPRARHYRSPSPPAAAAAAAGSDTESSASESTDASTTPPATADAPRRRRALAKGKKPITKSIAIGYQLMVRRRAMEAAQLAAQRAFVDTHYAYGLAAPDPAALVCRVLNR